MNELKEVSTLLAKLNNITAQLRRIEGGARDTTEQEAVLDACDHVADAINALCDARCKLGQLQDEMLTK